MIDIMPGIQNATAYAIAGKHKERISHEEIDGRSRAGALL
jgi:hypothetical protein